MRLRVALAVVLLSLGTLSAQSFRGGIQGTVTDATGAAVAGAEVTATNTGTALARTTTSNDQGDYFFNELPLGDYTVTVSKGGFKTQTMKGVTVEVSSSQHVDVKLTPGEIKEAVEVTAAVPLVDTTSNVLGGTISGKTASDLPISGRDFIKLLVFVPGATADASGVSDSPGAFGQFSINGSRGRSNNYLLDGTDMNDGYRNDSAINEAGVFGTPATLLPIDALAEVPILSGVEAEYGRNSGATVNIVTKSGTNSFHGSVFEYFRNDALDARNFFNTKPGRKNEFRNNQYGGSLGGPIWKDHTFFFVAYEGQREVVGIPTPSTIPTQDQITCFVTLGGAINPITANILALNPWTQGAAFPASGDGGPATPDCITNPATALSTTLAATGSNFLHSFIGKIDHHFGGGDVLTGRYFYGHSDQSFPLGLVGGSAVPGYNTVTPTTVHLVSVSYTHTISPRTLLEIRGGYNSFFETFFPQDKGLDPSTLGLNTVASSQDFGLSTIRFGDGTSAIGANTSLPRGRTDTNWQLFANMAHIQGRHNLKWGYEFRRTVVDEFFDSGYRGVINFDTFDDFLNGAPSGGRQAAGNSKRRTFENNHSFYFQDSFKATSRLTLNLGIRWDYFGVIGEEKNRFSFLDPNPVTGGLFFTHQAYPKDFNNFAPRVSFAWDIWGDAKTVLRGGWGVYYDAFSQDFFGGQLPFNTFNPGPIFNPIGPDAILFNFGPANMTPVAGPCVAPNIAIPGSAMCAPPVFAAADFLDSDVFTIAPNLRTPYVQNYNVNVQHEFSKNTALQLGYVGSSGRKLFRYRDINQGTPGVAGRPFDSGPFAPSGGTFFYVNQFESTSNSQYNALQSTFRIRNLHGLNSTVNYTWGHSIDNASDGQDFVAQATQPDNSFRPDRERANSNFDTRHRFTWLMTYEFPKAAHTQWLLSGWAVDSVFAFASGQPYNLTWQFEDDFNGTGEFFGRPDVVGDPFAGTGGLNILNLNAFAVPCTVDPLTGSCLGGQHFGNLRRNAFRGPDFKNLDFSLVKNTKLGEKVTMQLRADFFNLLNHPNFTNPTLPNFAVDFLGNGMEQVAGNFTGRGVGFLRPTATPDVGIGNPFLGGGGPRNIQLPVRLSF